MCPWLNGLDLVPASNWNSISLQEPFFNPFFFASELFLPVFTFLPQHRLILLVGWLTHSFTYPVFLLLPPIFSAFTFNMSLARIPLPSIALVLASDHTALPSRPSVIKFEFDPLQTIYLTSPGPTRVLVCWHLFLFVDVGLNTVKIRLTLKLTQLMCKSTKTINQSWMNAFFPVSSMILWVLCFSCNSISVVYMFSSQRTLIQIMNS